MNKVLTLLITIITIYGCNKQNSKMVVKPPEIHSSGQVKMTFSSNAGGERSFHLVLPDNYSTDEKYKLVINFPGTSTTGKEMKEFVGDGWNSLSGFESYMSNTIFVYPDPKWRYFDAWDETFGGWLLGPYSGDLKGMEDINFISELLDSLNTNYSIDQNKVFATGHSWGGDMAAVVGCFLGDKFTAIAPVAANRPYWFESGSIALNCMGTPAVWTFFGNNDEHFDGQEPNKGNFGIEQNKFWKNKYSCSFDSTILDINPSGESVEYKNCSSPVRFSLYSPNFSGNSDQPGHQPPDYYLKEVPTWFNSF